MVPFLPSSILCCVHLAACNLLISVLLRWQFCKVMTYWDFYSPDDLLGLLPPRVCLTLAWTLAGCLPQGCLTIAATDRSVGCLTLGLPHCPRRWSVAYCRCPVRLHAIFEQMSNVEINKLSDDYCQIKIEGSFLYSLCSRISILWHPQECTMN